MDCLSAYLVRYNFALLFIGILAEQLGWPLPAFPLLVIAGAVAYPAITQFAAAVSLAFLACLLSDVAWYEAGRIWGRRVLRLICRVSSHADLCVRHIQNTCLGHKFWPLLIAKFIPGLGLIAAPLAGLCRMNRSAFLILDGLGCFSWSAGYVGLGFLFSRQMRSVIAYGYLLGGLLGLVLLSAFTVILWQQIHLARSSGQPPPPGQAVQRTGDRSPLLQFIGGIVRRLEQRSGI